MDQIVRARGVRKVYRNGSEVAALKGIDLDICRGELLTVGIRQDDAAELPVRPGKHRRRRDPGRGG